jgi:predicted ester cyclase
VTKAALLAFSRGYTACLNRQDWPNLARFVSEDMVGGRRVRFCEIVIYRLRDDKIEHVWSIIDKAAIEAQLRNSSDRDF